LRLLLDTSVLIAGDVPAEPETAISTVSIAELHFGLLVAADEEERALRTSRLGLLEARFPDPLALDDRVAREWGRLLAAVAERGGRPRKRMADLAIAATATVHGVSLLTHNTKDFKIIEDLVDVHTVKQAIREHDVVELLDTVGRWPAGTRGTVVDERGEWKQVEISDDQGQVLDLISVVEPRLKLVVKHSGQSREA
jgi:predicted nucleic acid-binding protein